MYLSNAFSLNMLDKLDVNIEVRPMSAREAAVEAPFAKSIVGHPDTAAVFSMVLGCNIAVNRQTIRLLPGDQVIVGQYRGPRLPEGATTLPEGAVIEWAYVSLGYGDQDWTEPLRVLAEKLPTGMVDRLAPFKLRREQQELQVALAAEDRLGAILEAADIAYYAAKVGGDITTVADATYDDMAGEEAVFMAADAVGLTFGQVVKVAEVKYALRARAGNPKDDVAERAAVAALWFIS